MLPNIYLLMNIFHFRFVSLNIASQSKLDISYQKESKHFRFFQISSTQSHSEPQSILYE